jgi:uncharacterized repeat protein (TIGR01451 family)
MKHHHASILVISILAVGFSAWHFTGHKLPFVHAIFVDHAHKGGYDGVPVNLSIKSIWDSTLKKGTVRLTWSPVSDAASYNIYQYDIKVGTTTSNTFLIPHDVFNKNMTYNVTAVNAAGKESIPSNIVGASEVIDPLNPPNWVVSVAPPTPRQVVARPEWNKGKPRVHLEWISGAWAPGGTIASTYNVYRDGQKVAEGLWGLNYFDQDVNPGETHTYQVSGVNDYWPTLPESEKSTALSATALTTPPAAINQKVNITGIVRNDDSFVVLFDPVPGAVDYRLYKDGEAVSSAKYAGERGASVSPLTQYSIEQNSVVTPGNYVIEAVDKFGPFQKMDGEMGPGGEHGMATNGQGDPSNEPIVLARSDIFQANNKPRNLTGSQVFFDKFQDSDPWTLTEFSNLTAKARRQASDLAEYQNPRWKIQMYTVDQDFSRVFTMNRHFMDTTYDGPSPLRSSFSHNNNASLIMVPKQQADISGDKVLHVTFEADAHFNGRRWMDVFIGGTDDEIIEPGKFAEFQQDVTPKNQIFRWQILENTHEVSLFNGKRTDGTLIQHTLLPAADHFHRPVDDTVRAILYNQGTETNGSNQEIDKRHIFDLYVSKNHVKITESTPDGKYNKVVEKDFPAGVELPWDKVNVYFVHQVYHTGNDRPDLVLFSEGRGKYWYNHRPYADERHWDNMGFEVLNDFSQANPTILPIEPVVYVTADPKASINVTQSVDKASAKVGDTLTYTISVENVGTGKANQVKLTASIPTETDFISAADGGVVSGSGVVWNELTLQPLERISRTFQVKIK